MVRPGHSAVRSLLILAVAALCTVLSGWTPPQSLPHAHDLTAARNVDGGHARPATRRRDNTIETDEGSGDVSGEETPAVGSLRARAQLVLRPHARASSASSASERACALARGPPTSRA